MPAARWQPCQDGSLRKAPASAARRSSRLHSAHLHDSVALGEGPLRQHAALAPILQADAAIAVFMPQALHACTLACITLRREVQRMRQVLAAAVRLLQRLHEQLS
jgi:hypothetical protein